MEAEYKGEDIHVQRILLGISPVITFLMIMFLHCWHKQWKSTAVLLLMLCTTTIAGIFLMYAAPGQYWMAVPVCGPPGLVIVCICCQHKTSPAQEAAAAEAAKKQLDNAAWVDNRRRELMLRR